MTHSGTILVIEPKGDFLDGENSQTKVEIRCEWQELAGRNKYRYYMAFPNKELGFKRAYRLEGFLKVIKETGI